MNSLKLTDLIPLEEWIALEKDIKTRSGLNAGVYDTEGIRITGYKDWCNTICPRINTDKKGQAFICAPAHQNLAAMAQNTRQGVAEECDAGIVKIVVPIFVDHQFLGTAGGCGLLLEEGEVEPFFISKTLEISEEEIETLAEGIGTLTESDAQSIIDYIQKRIDGIVADYHSP